MPKTAALPNNTTSERFVTGPEVCARYGIVQMSLWRWLRDPTLRFLQPALRIRDRRYWREADLVAWERASAAARHRARA